MKTFFTICLLVLTLSAWGQVSPIQLGRSSNVFTITSPAQNQVLVNNSLNTVAFIHQHDVTIYGGGSFENSRLRYDISIDGGATFTSDLGVLNSTFTHRTRTPQMIFRNPAGNTTLSDADLVWTATTRDPIDQPNGLVGGLLEVNTSSPSSTENYLTDTLSNITGGLSEGLPGEFWMVDFELQNFSINGKVALYRGVFDATSNDVSWSFFMDFTPSYEVNNPVSIGSPTPNLAFSPNGMNGWIAYPADLAGGNAGALNPVFFKTSDGGVTWSTAMEADLSTISWLVDSVSQGLPANGRPTTAFDFDLTVDANGNPHFFTVVGDTLMSYGVDAKQWKGAVDISSPDGGVTWEAHYISPVLTLRGEFGTPDPNGDLLPMDNFSQVSRTEDGSKIFYSWVDSDTLQTGAGGDNLAPNLRIAGRRIADGFQTCVKMVTDGDLLWDGSILFPTMAPTVLEGSGTYNLPIVCVNMIQNDQLAPCQFYYYGNDALISDGDFKDPASINFNWNAIAMQNCIPTGIESLAAAIGFKAFPNPASEAVNLEWDAQRSHLELKVFGITGQAILSRILPAGSSSTRIAMDDLTPGMYLIQLTTEEGSLLGTQRMIKK